MKPIILSGGSGTRLWPASKPLKPKQFLKLVNDNYNLFQDTCTRLEELGCDSPIVVCNEKTKNLVTQSLQEINVNNAHIILEPTARDTAPAIAVAALKAIENGDDPVLLVLPSDHVINHKDKFKSAVTRAEKLALDGNLVTFGITPTEPNTGFGYIQVGTSIEPEAYKVQSFKEKPNKSTAKHMIKQGGHLWNGGMFAFKASVFLKELKTHAPDIFKAAKFALDKSKSNHEYTLLNKNEFQKVRKTSIDYAVMEKTKNAAVVELNTQWYDVGTWRSLYEYSEKDSNGNVKKGNANIITIDSKNNLVYSTARDISIVLGNVEGLFVVQADNDILVANSEANMRKIVAEVKKSPPNIKFVKVSEAPNQGKQIVFVNAKSNTMLCAIAAYTNTIAEQLRNFGYDVKEVGVNQLDDASPEALTQHIKSLANGKEQVVHLQYPHKGYPKQFNSSFLQSFKNNVLTLHEFSSRPAYIQNDIDKTIEYAKKTVFTQKYEQDYAYSRLGEKVGLNTVISIPSNIRISQNVKGFNNKLNIINFGGIRRKTKGIEDVIELARELKEFTLSLEKGPRKNIFSSIRVKIVGNVRQKSFEDYKYFISLVYSLTEKEEIQLKEIRSLKELQSFIHGKEKNLPVDFHINETDENLSQLLAESSFAYLPYPDGVSQRRGTFAACAEHECIVVTTKSDKTPYEMMSMEGAIFSNGPRQALEQFIELVENVDERVRLQESVTQLVSDRRPANVAKEHTSLYQGKKELLKSIPKHLKSQNYEEMLSYSKLLIEDKGIDIKELIKNAAPYVQAKDYADLNSADHYAIVKNNTKQSIYEIIDAYYKTNSNTFRLLVKKTLETPTLPNTKDALTYLVQKLQKEDKNSQRVQILAEELLLHNNKILPNTLNLLEPKARTINSLSGFAPYYESEALAPDHIKELIVFTGEEKAGVSDISQVFTSALQKKNHRLKNAVVIDVSEIIKDIFPFIAENSPFPLTDSMQKKVDHDLVYAKARILDIFEKVVKSGRSVIINYENPDYSILNKIAEIGKNNDFNRKQLVGVSLSSVKKQQAKAENSVCVEGSEQENKQTNQGFLDYFLSESKSTHYSSSILFENSIDKDLKLGFIPKPIYFSNIGQTYFFQKGTTSLFDSLKRDELSQSHSFKELSQIKYLSNPILDIARNIHQSGKSFGKVSSHI